jgi:pyridoxine 5-phosphate synthase
MTRLSININKFATLRNSRGGNNPDLIMVALDAERYGAQGITVHPRPDERHIRYQDVLDLKPVIKTEFNIEGFPDERYLKLVESVLPAQATLVPDSPDQLTSNTGWDTITNKYFLKQIIEGIKSRGIRVSVFVNPDENMIEGAAAVGADRVELYTGQYSSSYRDNPETAIAPFVHCARLAKKLGLGINAGHDLNLENLRYFKQNVTCLDEVSIGHAIVCDSLYLGLENTIQLYLRQLR